MNTRILAALSVACLLAVGFAASLTNQPSPSASTMPTPIS